MHPFVRVAYALLIPLSGFPAQAQLPDARDVLKSMRIAQTAQDRSITGQLRHGARKAPFRLSMKDGQVKWEFTDAPPLTLLLRMGEKASTLEEITPDGKAKVGGVRFENAVRGTDITYEDLSMRFLYWPDATVEGEDSVMTVDCWRVLIKAPKGEKTNYSQVRAWIAKDSGALMKAEAFNPEGKLARVFTVRGGQKTSDGLWILKQMRIESAAGFGGDRTPTYLELDKPE
jgi:hypothetical protein